MKTKSPKRFKPGQTVYTTGMPVVSSTEPLNPQLFYRKARVLEDHGESYGLKIKGSQWKESRVPEFQVFGTEQAAIEHARVDHQLMIGSYTVAIASICRAIRYMNGLWHEAADKAERARRRTARKQ